MALPTNQQIDTAVPVAGQPVRSLVNTLLKAIIDAATYLPGSDSLARRTVENGVYTAGRLKAAPGMDPDDCITVLQGLIRTGVAPTSATSEGEVGDFFVDTDYVYICQSMNNWVRIPTAAW